MSNVQPLFRIRGGKGGYENSFLNYADSGCIRMFVMISYDVVDDKKRIKLMKFLKDYGDRVQKSVFECNLSPKIYEKLKAGVEEIIDQKKDRVRYYKICKGCIGRIEISGWGEVTEEEEFLVV